MRLEVRVNDELVLDAGECEQVVGEDGPEWFIRPPATSLFQQVIAYLRAKPDPAPMGLSKIGREGVAAAAVVLRWGSYLSVLLDRDKPLWSEVTSAETSRISDAEMARINIEASAALAEWIDLYRRDPSAGEYATLVDRAIKYLPMPQREARREASPFSALGVAEIAAEMTEAVRTGSPSRYERARADASGHPTRVFANALVNTAWRNGPVESIHAGVWRGYPLLERRMTPAEERKLMRVTSGRLAEGMWCCFGLSTEKPLRPWPEQVLPFGLAELAGITPSRWTLTETSRHVRLPI